MGNKLEQVTIGGGCFWCLEAPLQLITGVKKIVSGYSAGSMKDPVYNEVASGITGHAEVVQLSYDPAEIGFEKILEVFFSIHDPTTLNRQGADIGTQYRSIILYHTPEQQKKAESAIKKLDESGIFNNPVVTQVAPLEQFYPAEAVHQNYYRSNPNQPYCSFVIKPKVDKIKRLFADTVVG